MYYSISVIFSHHVLFLYLLSIPTIKEPKIRDLFNHNLGVSEESKNNIIENNILLNTSSTTYSGNTNILEINKKENLQLQTKNDLKYNEHFSDKNNTIDTNSRNTYSTNGTSY